MKNFKCSLNFCLLLLISCNSNKINVTSQYIEFKKNPVFFNGFQLSLIVVTDNKTPPQQYTEVEGGKYGILTDSTFRLSNKIYFDRKQKGFKWVRMSGGEKVDSIGHLLNNRWYLIKNLHHLGYKIFVHITENGHSEVYVDQRENW